ncbi:putative protein unzipped [Penaeus vannamei]|uniref:Uncharacterized protein n=1 Tax=Penaeus vannamei TaxID=6689 RepID=A0A3R7NFR8_PENVA|nr:putative protein unzipped [Penaeus vannamei]
MMDEGVGAAAHTWAHLTAAPHAPQPLIIASAPPGCREMPGVPKGCPCNASFRWFRAGAPADTAFDGACERVASVMRFIKGRRYVKAVKTLLALAALSGSCLAAVDMVMLWGASGTSKITSSTLAWVTGTDKIPEEAVAVDPSSPAGPHWCRARHRALQVPGVLRDDGVCTIPFLKRIFKLDKYDVLVSINGSARLHLKPWDKYTAKPDNAVLSPDLMLAFDSSPHAPLMPGHVGPDLRDRRAFLLDGDNIRRVEKAYILVEEEPARYSLSDIVLDASHQTINDSRVHLKKVTLENTGEEPVNASRLVTIDVRERQYWGRVKGTVTALSSTVTSPEDAPIAMPSPNAPVDLLWGIDNELGRVDTQMLVHELPPGVGVEVDLEGTMRHYEAPYSGTLSAFYADGSSHKRGIVSLHIHDALVGVTANYRRYYYIHNGTDVDLPESADLLGPHRAPDRSRHPPGDGVAPGVQVALQGHRLGGAPNAARSRSRRQQPGRDSEAGGQGALGRRVDRHNAHPQILLLFPRHVSKCRVIRCYSVSRSPRCHSTLEEDRGCHTNPRTDPESASRRRKSNGLLEERRELLRRALGLPVAKSVFLP